VVWIPTSLIIFFAAKSIGLWLPPSDAIHVFSYSTILGGLSLSPAGLGITGSVMILNLDKLNFSLPDSVTIVTIVRLMSTGLYLSLGGIFMAREFYEYRRAKNKRIEFHFDEISTEYQNQFKDHVWNYLLSRKSGYMASTLKQKSLMHGLGLDLGCGLGLQSQEMKRRGYNVFGMDMAYNLLSHAKGSGFDVVNGDALRLPFKDESLDYVYTIGVLHHLSGSDFQKKVCEEVHRVLKPGGIFIVHETNPRNPLFRFYMGYIFPILRSIDEGTEWWIEPNFWEQTRGLDLVNVTYFTFMPDFIPEFLMKQFHRIERFLEQSAFREYSVHYMAVVEKI
jgi:SAM-dependent methyltransferase